MIGMIVVLPEIIDKYMIEANCFLVLVFFVSSRRTFQMNLIFLLKLYKRTFEKI